MSFTVVFLNIYTISPIFLSCYIFLKKKELISKITPCFVDAKRIVHRHKNISTVL